MAEKPNQAALKRFEEKFTRNFGADTIERSAEIIPYEVVSTGSLLLDYATGVGGLVEGRLTEFWGPDAAGKTTMALLAVAEAQRKHSDKMAAFIDMEQTFDKAWAEQHGVDLTRLYHVRPESAEDVADQMKEIVSSGLFSIVVLDSIGAMIPEAEKQKDADEAVMAVQAKIVTRMVKIAAVEARKTSTVVLLVNQVRANLSYGSDTTTGGGFALKHVTTHKMKIKRTGTPLYKAKIGSDDRVVGQEIAIEVERNKVAPPKRTAIISLFHMPTAKFGPIGVDKADEATVLGISLGFVEQQGAWYIMPDGEKVQGREKVIEYLRAHPDMVATIRERAIATRVDEVIHDEEPVPEPVKEKAGKKVKPKFRKAVDA